MLRPSRRADALVFALVLLGAGYFHQGGGWNQNSRLALVRSIVEDGSFSIDSHLVYERAVNDESAPGQLARVPVRSGNFERGGEQFALAWRSPAGTLLPLDPAAAGARRLAAVDDVAATGDVAYFAGHVHPNKAPGTSFLAVPGYALLRTVQGFLGLDADRWAVLTFNAWAVSLLSVGLVTAVAAVLVLQLARRFGSELAARLAALSFAFATMAWPYGTFLFEHNIIAAALVGALWCIERTHALARVPESATAARRLLHGAGMCAGYAAITNYTMAALVPIFAIYLLARLPWARGLLWYGLGVLWPLLAICAYNQACFGTPFTTNYAYQSAMFMTQSRVLGVFAMPRFDVLLLLLFSPFRGLFFTSPVLLASIAALAAMRRGSVQPSLAALVVVVAGFLLLVNSSFNGWDGGWTAVPRYLGPAMALLAVPLAIAFDRWRAITCGLAGVSLVIQLLLAAVDPQVPIGDVGTAGVPVSKVFTIDPMTRYVVPLFTSGRAWPMLDESIEQAAARASRVAAQRGDAPAEIERKAAQLRSDLRDRIARGEGSPLPLGGVTGPVSANPIGVYEGYYYRLFEAGSPQARGNSFNLGELVFPQSRLSLLPLLLLAGALLVLLFRQDDETASAPGATRTASAEAPRALAESARLPGRAAGKGKRA